MPASALPAAQTPQPVPTLGAGTGGEWPKRSFSVTYLPFQVSGFIRSGSREDSRVTEAGPKQSPHHKEEQDATDHGDGRGDFLCEVPTAVSRVQREGRNESR